MQALKTTFAVVIFPFVFVLCCVALIGLLIFNSDARGKFFSDQRHK